MKAYQTGFCKIAGPDDPEADFYCSDGPKSAGWMVGQTINGYYTKTDYTDMIRYKKKRVNNMKQIMLSLIGLVLVIGAPSVYAETAFQSGYYHGCSDINKPVPERYINTIGQEASHHTAEFMKGYHQGFRACGGSDAQDSSNFLDIKPGQHYGVCEEIGPNNELGCDVLNDTSTTGGLYDLKLSDNPRADFQSGLQHGKADVKASCNHPEGCHWWIRMRGNGFMNQTQEFVRGYVLGFCSNSEFGSIGSIVAQASFDCDKGPQGARYKPMNSSDFWTPNMLVTVSTTQQSENESGFKLGVDDAFLTKQNQTTNISEPGNGMGNHTQVFNDGYQKGWCSVMGLDHGIEEPYAEFDCVDQP